jgi:hypothetical protein
MIAPLFAALIVAPDRAPAAETEIVGASLFKNGYALVTREIDIPAEDEFYVEVPPRSVLGTFWIETTDGVIVTEAVRTTREKEETFDASTLVEILRQNMNEPVELAIRLPYMEEPEEVVGEILMVNDQIVIVRSEGGEAALPVGAIQGIATEAGDLDYKVERTTVENVIRIKTNGSAEGALYFFGLEQGLQWSPSYRAALESDDDLSLALRATVLNSLGDLNEVPLRLVTGFPNLPYLNSWDPFTNPGDVTKELERFARREAVPTMQNQVVAMDLASSAPSIPLGTTQIDDLFYYDLPPVTLKNGDSGYYVVSNSEGEYERVFTLDIGQVAIERGGLGQQRPLDVWNEIEFDNPAGNPLTTAVATIFRSEEIVGQDMLNYVPATGSASLRLSKALDVQATEIQEEVGRERGALQVGRQSYDLVTVKGTITIVNRKSEAVPMRVRKTFDGDLVSKPAEVEAIELATSLGSVNPMTRLEWTPEVAAGEEVEMIYSYEYYFPTP